MIFHEIVYVYLEVLCSFQEFDPVWPHFALRLQAVNRLVLWYTCQWDSQTTSSIYESTSTNYKTESGLLPDTPKVSEYDQVPRS